ncbi:MAG: GNAT family N-acetyltransferase [Pseudomonadota bacterium]|nr:GNAT family N-acetyltransferase [Pseudomonadota bacterium]
MNATAIELLRDGTRMCVRRIVPEDAVMEMAFITGLSPESRYRRFFSTMPHVTPEMVKRFTQIDDAHEMALVAIHDEGKQTEAIVGVARYVREADASSAEFAVVVADEWQARGLATRLLERLIGCARTSGISQLHGPVLASNAPMLELMRHLGFTTRSSADGA